MIMKKLLLMVLLLVPNISNWYNFEWKEYNIYVPENIQYMEYCYFSWQCEIGDYYTKLIYVNFILINRWFEPLY